MLSTAIRRFRNLYHSNDLTKPSIICFCEARLVLSRCSKNSSRSSLSTSSVRINTTSFKSRNRPNEEGFKALIFFINCSCDVSSLVKKVILRLCSEDWLISALLLIKSEKYAISCKPNEWPKITISEDSFSVVRTPGDL